MKVQGCGKSQAHKWKEPEGRDEWGSLEASEKLGMLQKKRRIWKNTLRRSENQEKGEEGSPEKLGNEEGGEGMAKRIPKEAQGI